MATINWDSSMTDTYLKQLQDMEKATFQQLYCPPVDANRWPSMKVHDDKKMGWSSDLKVEIVIDKTPKQYALFDD